MKLERNIGLMKNNSTFKKSVYGIVTYLSEFEAFIWNSSQNGECLTEYTNKRFLTLWHMHGD
jgi:hypothetical protein